MAWVPPAMAFRTDRRTWRPLGSGIHTQDRLERGDCRTPGRTSGWGRCRFRTRRSARLFLTFQGNRGAKGIPPARAGTGNDLVATGHVVTARLRSWGRGA